MPEPLLPRVMEIANDSFMESHMGTKKTTDKVLNNFYWPGVHGDVVRFCRSCDRYLPTNY